jgi:RNA-directed DNA polymerase
MISRRIAEAEALARAAETRGTERNSGELPLGAEVCTATSGRTKSESHERCEHKLMERVVERSNMRLAYQRVVENKGAAGVDEMPVSELKDWLAAHWPRVKKALLEADICHGRYEGWTYPSRMAGCGHSECQRWWTG